MRTTLNIDDDVLDEARRMAAQLRVPFRHVVNEALRTGLSLIEEPPARPFRTQPRQMGLKAGRNLNNIQELLAQAEGEDYR